MVRKHPVAPVSFAVWGALVAYYVPALLAGAGLPRLFPPVLGAFLLVAALGALRGLRTLALLPSEGGPALARRLRVLELYLAFLTAGFAAGFAARLAVPAPPAFGMPPERIVALAGVLDEDPRLVPSGRGMGRLDLAASAAADGTRASAGGKVSVFFPEESFARLKDFGRGAGLYLEGTLLPPREEGGQPVFNARGVHVTAPAGRGELFRTRIRLGIAEFYGGKPWGDLALALLLGIRDNLDAGLSRAYRDAGLSHILALSGMHLGIIAAVLAFLLRRPLGLRVSSAVSAAVILFYVYLAAAQPSLVRSAVMYLFGTLCVLFALPAKLPLILGLSFVVQIVIWPGAGDSVSFVLSYLALAGILFVGAPLGEIFRGRVPPLLASPLTASLGAFIASMGVTALYFSLVQPVGILAGLLVSPLTTVFMIAAMAAPLFSPVPALAGIADQVPAVLHRVLGRIVTWAGMVPPLRTGSWVPALAVSLALAWLVFHVRNRVVLPGEELAPFASA